MTGLHIHQDGHQLFLFLVAGEHGLEVEAQIVVEGALLACALLRGKAGVGETECFCRQLRQTPFLRAHVVDVSETVAGFEDEPPGDLVHQRVVITELKRGLRCGGGKGQALVGVQTQAGSQVVGHQHLMEAVCGRVDEAALLVQIAEHKFAQLETVILAPGIAHSALKSSPKSASSYALISW